MLRQFSLRIVFILFFLSVCSFSAQAEESQKIILDNGLVVVVEEMSTSPLVSVYGLVKTGSATEGEFLGDLSRDEIIIGAIVGVLLVLYVYTLAFVFRRKK